MKKTLMLLVTSTALTAAIGVPAWGCRRSPDRPRALGPREARRPDVPRRTPGCLRSSTDDDDRRRDHRASEGRVAVTTTTMMMTATTMTTMTTMTTAVGATRTPAPAGTIAPPQNGLFGNGAPPQVQVN